MCSCATSREGTDQLPLTIAVVQLPCQWGFLCKSPDHLLASRDEAVGQIRPRQIEQFERHPSILNAKMCCGFHSCGRRQYSETSDSNFTNNYREPLIFEWATAMRLCYLDVVMRHKRRCTLKGVSLGTWCMFFFSGDLCPFVALSSTYVLIYVTAST